GATLAGRGTKGVSSPTSGCAHEELAKLRTGRGPAGRSHTHRHVSLDEGTHSSSDRARHPDRRGQSSEAGSDALSRRPGFQRELPEDPAGELAGGGDVDRSAQGTGGAARIDDDIAYTRRCARARAGKLFRQRSTQRRTTQELLGAAARSGPER